MKKPPTTSLFGLEIFAGTKTEFLQRFKVPHGLPAIVFTPNPEQIVLAHRDASFQAILRQATYLIPDGVGLVVASQLLHFLHPNALVLKERIAGTDVVIELLKTSKKVLVIGGHNYTQHAGIHWIEGFANVKNPTSKEERTIFKTLSELQPEIVFVAFGAPAQEKFITKYYDSFIDNKVQVVMAVGGAFDFIWGKVPRAPRAVQNSGLEWLYRLIQEPWRWKRQLRLLQFVGLTFQEAVKNSLA